MELIGWVMYGENHSFWYSYGSSQDPSRTLKIWISGAVVKPGLFRMPSKRVVDFEYCFHMLKKTSNFICKYTAAVLE